MYKRKDQRIRWSFRCIFKKYFFLSAIRETSEKLIEPYIWYGIEIFRVVTKKCANNNYFFWV